MADAATDTIRQACKRRRLNPTSPTQSPPPLAAQSQSLRATQQQPQQQPQQQQQQQQQQEPFMLPRFRDLFADTATNTAPIPTPTATHTPQIALRAYRPPPPGLSREIIVLSDNDDDEETPRVTAFTRPSVVVDLTDDASTHSGNDFGSFPPRQRRAPLPIHIHPPISLEFSSSSHETTQTPHPLTSTTTTTTTQPAHHFAANSQTPPISTPSVFQLPTLPSQVIQPPRPTITRAARRSRSTRTARGRRGGFDIASHDDPITGLLDESPIEPMSLFPLTLIFRPLWLLSMLPADFGNDGMRPASEKQIKSIKAFHLREDSEDSCCVCLDGMKEGDKVKKLGCPHMFHASCIDEWLQRNAVCPVCKRDV